MKRNGNIFAEADERTAWAIFRKARWGEDLARRHLYRPRCPYCHGDAREVERRKGGNQFIYRCTKCERKFSDVTGTPFEGSRLPMLDIFFLVVLVMAGETSGEICELMRIAKTTLYRHQAKITREKVMRSQLCRDILPRLAKLGVTENAIRKFLELEPPGRQLCPRCGHARDWSIFQFPKKQEQYYRCPGCGEQIKTLWVL